MTHSTNITSLTEYKEGKAKKSVFPDNMVMGFQLNSTITDEEVKNFMDELSKGKAYMTFSFDSSKILAFKKP
jgi:hypothetical protein